jgi:hypothetical protein
LTSKRLQQPETEFNKIANTLALELEKMDPQQQLFAKKAINEILFEGQMGTLHRYSVQININSSGTSTPHSEQPLSTVYYQISDSEHQQSHDTADIHYPPHSHQSSK